MSLLTKEQYENRTAFTHRILVEVKKRPFLWRRSDPMYPKRYAAQQAWVEIGNILGVKPDVAKLRWRYLRDIFQKELKRIQKQNVEGGDVKDLRLWKYFRNMLFLKEEYADPRQYPAIEVDEIEPDVEQLDTSVHDEFVDVKNYESNNDSLTDIDDEEEEYLEEFYVYSKPNSESDPISKETSSLKDSNKSSEIKASNPVAESSNSAKKRKVEGRMLVEHKTQSEESLNEDLLFVKSLVPYFKGLDPVRKLRLKSKIQNLIADELEKD